MFEFVRDIFLMRFPLKIFRGVVCFITIAMGRFKALRSVAMKCFTYQRANEVIFHYAIFREGDAYITLLIDVELTQATHATSDTSEA